MEESEIFRSQFIKTILNYKWDKLKYLGYLLLAIYCTYLVTLVFFYKAGVLIFWLVWQCGFEAY